MMFYQIELDMEQEELEIRRIIFEAELKLFFSDEYRKLKYEEFVDFDKEYDRLRNTLNNDILQG